MKKIILVFIFILYQLSIFAQLREMGNNGRSGRGGNQEINTNSSDTTKKTSERVVSGKLSGDTIHSFMKTWIFEDKLLHNKLVSLDTVITNFHIYDPVIENNNSNARIGNVGLASKSNNFFNSLATHNYVFFNSFNSYLLSNENVVFYQTNLPFTSIFHSSSTKQVDEQNLRILHTQNISPKFNVGFKYNVINADGQMTNNSSIINSGALWTSFLSEKYNIQSNFILNKIQNKENGGITDTNFVAGAELDPVNLNNAKTLMSNLGFMLHQKYKLGINKVSERIITRKETNDSIAYDTIFIPYASLNHTFKLNRAYRVYKDSENASSLFYPSAIDPINTYDSTLFLKIENTFQIQFNENQQAKFKFRARAFARNELLKYGSNWGGSLPAGAILNQDYLSRAKTESFSNTSIGGAIFDYSSKKWNWNFEGEVFLMGRRAGDVELVGDMERVFSTKTDSFIVSIHGSYKNKTPFYLYEYFNSNHYNWHNQFNNENELLTTFSFEYPRLQLKTKLQMASIDDYIYFGSDVVPVQARENINVLSVTVNKNISIGAFSWNNEVVYQLLSDKKILQMPEIIYKTQLYADFFLAKKALKLQAGVEMLFTSEYDLPAYNPVIGQFYQNTETPNTRILNKETNILEPISGLIPTKGGNYPLLSGFINFQIKKVLLFVNFRNVNYLWDKNHNYTTYLYPIEKMTFHWGVVWRFYN